MENLTGLGDGVEKGERRAIGVIFVFSLQVASTYVNSVNCVPLHSVPEPR